MALLKTAKVVESEKRDFACFKRRFDDLYKRCLADELNCLAIRTPPLKY